MAGPTKKVGRRVYEAPTTTKGKFVDTKSGKPFTDKQFSSKMKEFEDMLNEEDEENERHGTQNQRISGHAPIYGLQNVRK